MYDLTAFGDPIVVEYFLRVISGKMYPVDLRYILTAVYVFLRFVYVFSSGALL